MRSDKYNRMIGQYDGHKGTVTVGAVLDGIPAELPGQLTGRQLGCVMSAINAAYHRGKTDAGAEQIDGGQAVWINKDGGGMMIQFDAPPGEINLSRYQGQEHNDERYVKV